MASARKMNFLFKLAGLQQPHKLVGDKAETLNPWVLSVK